MNPLSPADIRSGRYRIDERGHVVQGKGKPRKASRKAMSRSERRAIYATWPLCPAGCPQCGAEGWDLFVPVATHSIGNQRGVRARMRVSLKQHAAVFATLDGRPRPRLPVVVRITRVTVTKSKMDGHAEWHKHIVDALADWMGCDDADPRITWQFAHAVGPVRGVRVQVKTRTPEMVAAIETAERVAREVCGW